jgi:hypothetical protein
MRSAQGLAALGLQSDGVSYLTGTAKTDGDVVRYSASSVPASKWVAALHINVTQTWRLET